MKRVLPTLGLTAAGLALVLNFDTRSATSIALSGSATITTAAGQTSTAGAPPTAKTAATTATTATAETPTARSTNSASKSAATLGSNDGNTGATLDPAKAERAQITSQLPDWVVQRIDEQFPDGISLNLLEQVAFQLGIQFDPAGDLSGTAPPNTSPANTSPANTSPANTSPANTAANNAVSPTAEVVDGPTANTPFGPYQVEVTIDGDQITDVSFIRTPRDMQSMAIARYALPRLTDQTLANQSGDVQFISGATYTSYAYQQSLQAALDAAGF